MTKNEKKFLSRRICWLCEQTLDRDECLAFSERCSEEMMAKRRAACLKTYKPRKVAREPQAKPKQEVLL